MAAVLVLAGLGLAAVVFSLMLVGLVLNLAFRVLLFPLYLLKWLAMAVVMLVVVPVFALAGLVIAAVFSVVAVVFGAIFSIPLLPMVALGVIVWALLAKSNRRPAAA